MLTSRQELESTLSEVIISSKLKMKKKVVGDIKKHLAANYQILPGDIQGWINDPKGELNKIEDLRELYLLTEQVYSKTGIQEINPNSYFTEAEISESRQFSGLVEQKANELDFPIVIPYAQIVGNSAYMVTLDIKTIDKLIDNQLLMYDFDLQREASYSKKRTGEIIKEATLNKKNLKEITEHLLEGTLVPTTLVWNAQTRSAESGTELVFNGKKMELTINKGTRLAIVDGYHRCRSSQNSLQINPELNFNFAVLITNYSTKRAQQYQAQIAKATPISTTRIQELEASRLSDNVVHRLREESDLKGRISQTNRIHSLNKEVVSYNVLADTIEEEFQMETRSDAEDVADFLIDFFNILTGSHVEEFLNNIEETRKHSLINDNNIFVGYIVIARRMFENGIKAKDIREYIKDIEFSRENPIWMDLGILDENKHVTDTIKARKSIKEYFEKIELKPTTKTK